MPPTALMLVAIRSQDGKSKFGAATAASNLSLILISE